MPGSLRGHHRRQDGHLGDCQRAGGRLLEADRGIIVSHVSAVGFVHLYHGRHMGAERALETMPTLETGARAPFEVDPAAGR